MKKSVFVIALCLLFNFCTTTNKLAKMAFHYALLGEDEMTVYSRIGRPTTIITASDGGKILMYEFYSIENIPAIEDIGPEDYSQHITSFTSKSGAFYDIRINPVMYKRQYMNYQEKVTSLMVFLSRQGTCVGFEQNLPKEKLEYYYDRLKTYIPAD